MHTIKPTRGVLLVFLATCGRGYATVVGSGERISHHAADFRTLPFLICLLGLFSWWWPRFLGFRGVLANMPRTIGHAAGMFPKGAPVARNTKGNRQ